MGLETARIVTRAIVLLTVIAWAGWDCFAVLRFGRPASISHLMWELHLGYRGFSLAVMLVATFLAWHFWMAR